MPDPTARFQEIEVERLVLREPNDGRVRAVIETVAVSDDDGVSQVPTVRLTLFTPPGEPALVAQVDGTGTAMLLVGHPNQGVTVAISRRAVDLWAAGSIVASLRSADNGAWLELSSADGTRILEGPKGQSGT